MSEQFRNYQNSKARLLDVLRVQTDPSQESPCRDQQVSAVWGTSTENSGIHMKLVAPYREMPFTFMLAHMEKGTRRETSMPETIILQCIAGRFRVTQPDLELDQVVAAPGFIEVLGNVVYTYEAIDEVYNIMKVSNENLG